MSNDIEEVVFHIIGFAGTAKGLAYEALAKAEEGDFEGASKLLSEADENFEEAHKVQTSIIRDEVDGEKIEFSLLLIHAQDHLMTALEARNLIEKMIRMYKQIKKV